MKNKGFTLAEVLITLTIIGVVAAITIPNLLTSTQGKEYQTGAKKALATLSNAITMQTATSGEDMEDFVCPNGNCNFDRIEQYFFGGNGLNPVIPFERRNANIGNTDYPNYKTKDGMIMYNATNIANNQNIAVIIVDTNGEKGPTRTDDRSWCQVGAVGPAFGGAYNGNHNCWGYSQNPTLWGDSSNTVLNNRNPDFTVFAINLRTGDVSPFNQATRNIISTGSAMMSR